MKYRVLHFVVIGLFIGCALGLAVRSTAQDVASPGNQAGSLGNVATLVQQLHLSPDQTQQVLPVLQQETPKLQAIKGSSTLSDSQKVALTKAVQKQSDSKLKGILSPEQFLSLKNFRSLQVQDLLHGTKPH